MKKKTLVIGASPNPERYSNKAISRLTQHGHPVIALGIQDGIVDGNVIVHGKKDYKDVDTVTMYLNPVRQKEYYDYIISLHPKRIIFNPGAENPELKKLAEENKIETEEACTLVMLGTGQF
jgi:uncharacterized protein